MNRKALAAGLLIGLGCIVNLSVDNRYIGALLFSLGLYFICKYGLDLYTGKCGYAANWNLGLARILLLNLVGISAACLLAGAAHPALASAASGSIAAKLAKPWLAYAVDSVFCGVLMFLAVDCFSNRREGPARNALSILFAVPCFILSGFEHSVANMGYLALAIPALTLSQILSAALYVLLSVIGNLLGSAAVMLLLKEAKPS
ncbi:MAG: formate/nitrite transporter family protein [Eubacteriales bacterium]|nr:formate/nitrite transporter family protein [Eubacteriales bacterium]